MSNVFTTGLQVIGADEDIQKIRNYILRQQEKLHEWHYSAVTAVDDKSVIDLEFESYQELKASDLYKFVRKEELDVEFEYWCTDQSYYFFTNSDKWMGYRVQTDNLADDDVEDEISDWEPDLSEDELRYSLAGLLTSKCDTIRNSNIKLTEVPLMELVRMAENFLHVWVKWDEFVPFETLLGWEKEGFPAGMNC